MRKALAVLDNSVSEMTAFLTANDGSPEGFMILPACVPGIEFDVFSHENMEGFYDDDNTPIPDGFSLVSEDYFQYLHKLTEDGQEHPKNTLGLPWSGQSGFVADMPTLEECQALNELPQS